MTEVEFHTGVPDGVAFACRLLRKAYRRGLRVLVTAPPEVLVDLDRSLWTFEERDFVPHVRVPGGAASVRLRTPIWLSASADAASSAEAPRLLVNVGAAAPVDMQAVDRLIEIVSTDPGEASRGRERWRAYRTAGLQVRHHAGEDAHG